MSEKKPFCPVVHFRHMSLSVCVQVRVSVCVCVSVSLYAYDFSMCLSVSLSVSGLSIGVHVCFLMSVFAGAFLCEVWLWPAHSLHMNRDADSIVEQ